MAEMLAIPRPRIRAECLEEARPCPWVGCQHHLLLEVEPSGERAPRLVLNVPTQSGQSGRRRGLASSAAARLVEMWIDDAVEQLFRMRHTCELDILDERGASKHAHAITDPVSESDVADYLNVRKQTISGRFTRARAIVRDALELDDDDLDDGLDVMRSSDGCRHVRAAPAQP